MCMSPHFLCAADAAISVDGRCIAQPWNGSCMDAIYETVCTLVNTARSLCAGTLLVEDPSDTFPFSISRRIWRRDFLQNFGFLR